MNAARTIAMACLLAAGLLLARPAGAAEPLRQYYSAWTYHPERGYWYRTFHYKPSPDYLGYRRHYCIHYASQPQYVFFYNPYERLYWGRFDVGARPGRQFSILDLRDRRERLSDVPAGAFPPGGEMPVLPGASDAARIVTPDDLPNMRRERTGPADALSSRRD